MDAPPSLLRIVRFLMEDVIYFKLVILRQLHIQCGKHNLANAAV